jgi:anti-sigma factor ChrR (cupin superfamily)
MVSGSEVALHAHTELELAYMLEERHVDGESECRPGDFVWRPGGNCHIARLKALSSSRSS